MGTAPASARWLCIACCPRLRWTSSVFLRIKYENAPFRRLLIAHVRHRLNRSGGTAPERLILRHAIVRTPGR
jgi:hypothetical protein